LERSDFGRRSRLLRSLGGVAIRGGGFGSRRRVGQSGRELADSQLGDFVGEVRQELVGSKAVGRRDVWSDRFGLGFALRDGNFGRFLIVRRDQRFGIEYQLVILVKLKLRFLDLCRRLASWSC